MTKYVILEDKLYKNVKEQADFSPKQVFMGKFNNGAKNLKKIFSNPITAIAYDISNSGGGMPKTIYNTEMDKKDIIKALDFWINDKVLENEKILKLTGQLQDFHETELKHLIEARGKVEKLDGAKTEFMRFYEGYKRGFSTNIIYTDTISCYYSIEQSPTEPENPYNTGTILTDLFTETTTFGGGIFNQISNSMLDAARAMAPINTGRLRERFSTRNYNPDPNTWSVSRSGNERNLLMVCDPEGVIIATGFRTQERAQAYIRAHLDNYSLPSEVSPPLGTERQPLQEFTNMYIHSINFTISTINPSTDLEFYGSDNGARISVKVASLEPTGNNIPHTIKILGGNSLIEIDGREYAVLDGGIRVSYDRGNDMRSHDNNDSDSGTEYPDMYVSPIGDNEIFAGGNEYVTTNIIYTGSNVDIHATVYMTGREIYNNLSPFEHPTVKVFNDRKDVIEINGHRVYCLSLEMVYK